ncbi:MAG: hypothetical protein H5U19_14700, partial [Rhodobacteraceae bacterium]|nr:hypothetical protein [Paracoccaceae bacterium]
MMIGIGIGIGIGNTRRVGGGFSPQDIFANGEIGAWYDFSNASKIYQDSDGLTPITSDLDPLGRIEPSAGTLGAATQALSARRFEYHTAGFIRHDTIDDALQIPISMTGNWTVAVAYAPIGNDWILVTNLNNNVPWVGVGVSGSTAAPVPGSGATQNSLYFDNTLSTATTRGGQYTLSQAAKSIVGNWTITEAIN